MSIAFRRVCAISVPVVLALILCDIATAQFGAKKDKDTELDDEPKGTIVLTLWELSLGNPAEHADDESKSKFAERINNKPVTFNSLKEVRELIGGLKSAGKLRSSRELRLVTLDGETASVQIGANKPRTVGINSTREGRVISNLQMEAVGTRVEARARIDSEKQVQVLLDHRMSDLKKSSDTALDAPAEGAPRMADIVVTQQLKTAARLKSGTAIVVQSDSSSGSTDDEKGDSMQLIILGAEIQPIEE